MKPLIVLLGTFVLSAATGRIISGNWSDIIFCGNLSMCVMLLFTTMGHFKFAKGMAMMIPSSIPYKIPIVYITGIAEVILGLLLLRLASRAFAGYALIIFFLLIFPSNIYAAMKRINLEKADYSGSGLSYLWFRVPEQLLFIAWVYYFSVAYV